MIKPNRTKSKKTSRCTHCPLKGDQQRVVSTEYYGEPGDIKVMFIGEAPGASEASQGRPFIGKAGRVLRRLITKINGGSLDGIAFGSVVRCRPTKQEKRTTIDRTPTQEEVGSCKNFLFKDIEKLDPDRIVLLGHSALTGIALDQFSKRPIESNAKIMPLRGNNCTIRTPAGKEYKTVITVNPSFVCRNPELAGVFEEDVRKVFWRLDPSYPKFQKRGKPAKILNTLPKVKKYLAKLSALGPKDTVALDFETGSLRKLGVRLLTIGFAHSDNVGYVIPYKHKESPWTGPEFRKVKKLLTKFFQTYRCTLVAHQLKFEANVIQDVFGVSLHNRLTECTLLRAQILNENRSALKEQAFGLKILVEDWMEFFCYRDPDIAPIVELRNRGMLDKASLRGLCEYNGMDCYAERRLYMLERWISLQQGKQFAKEFRRYSRKLSGPASIFATQLERHGINTDRDQLRYFMGPDSPIINRMNALEESLQDFETVQEANRRILQTQNKISGMESIWGEEESPWIFGLTKKAHLQVLFLEVLKLKPISYTDKGNPRVNKDFYNANAGVPEIDVMLEWAEYQKLKSTYIEGVYRRLENDPDMQDGRVRGDLNLHKTVTGRTSFSNPNMQNIPRGKNEEARAIKRLYIAGPGRLMVCGDYSQAEVRWWAQIADDQKLIDQYKKVVKIHKRAAKHPTQKNALLRDTEGDFHTGNAAIVFGKDPADVSKNERNAAKGVVFGNIYGMGLKLLSSNIKRSIKEAKKFQKMFFDQFKKASKWLEQIEVSGFKNGYVESPLGGRRRHLASWFLLGEEFKALKKKRWDDLAPIDRRRLGHKAFEDRASRNSPIQGVASDTNLLACILLNKYIQDNNKDWWVMNVVHDSIIADIPIDEVEEYIAVSQKIMQDPNLFAAFKYIPDVPFMVDFSIGWNWGDQYDVGPVKTWKVSCKEDDCGGGTAYIKLPKKCPKCGSKKIKREFTAGPAAVVLKYLNKMKKRKAN